MRQGEPCLLELRWSLKDSQRQGELEHSRYVFYMINVIRLTRSGGVLGEDVLKL